MASRNGPMISGTDGSDYLHRETVATHYMISCINKSRLRKCIFFHLLLALVLVVKMVPDILDRLDIFVLEIEELEVPQPLKWEYLWLASSLSSFIGLHAIRRNHVRLMQIYFGLVNICSTVPVLFASMLFFSDFYEFCTSEKLMEDSEDMQTWRGYPVAVLWYCFLLVAMQVHVFTLIFTWKLLSVWHSRTTMSAAKKTH